MSKRAISSTASRAYLGVEIYTSYTRIKREKVHEFKAKVKKITRRNSPVNLKKVIADQNPVIRGFAYYFRIANCKTEYKTLMQWIRKRQRSKQLSLWKRAKRLHRRLRQLGSLASYALPNRYLREEGLFEMEAVQTGYLLQNY